METITAADLGEIVGYLLTAYVTGYAAGALHQWVRDFGNRL